MVCRPHPLGLPQFGMVTFFSSARTVAVSPGFWKLPNSCSRMRGSWCTTPTLGMDKFRLGPGPPGWAFGSGLGSGEKLFFLSWMRWHSLQVQCGQFEHLCFGPSFRTQSWRDTVIRAELCFRRVCSIEKGKTRVEGRRGVFQQVLVVMAMLR